MKKSKILKLESIEGEKHFIVQECNLEPSSNRKKYSQIEAKKATKKEASKPLLISRV